MKKKIVVLALIILLMSGCGSKIPTLSNGDEAVVTLKDGSMISANELYEAIKDDYALETMVTLVDKKILEDKYKSKVEEAKEYASSNISQLEAYYGDTLLDAIKQNTNYTSIEAYQDSIYLGYLQDLAIEDYCKKQIKDKDIEEYYEKESIAQSTAEYIGEQDVFQMFVNEYYEKEVVGDIKVSHILITPKVTEDMTDDEKANAEAEAKDKIEAIISELNKTDKNEKTVEVEFKNIKICSPFF